MQKLHNIVGLRAQDEDKHNEGDELFRQSVHVLGIFHAANCRREEPIEADAFYNDVVN